MSWINQTKRAYVTKPSSDKHTYHIAQVSYMERHADIELVTPYGLYSTPPANSLVTMWNINGQEENRVGIANNPKGRFKNLKPGEVSIGSPDFKSSVYFKKDGSLVVTATQESAGTTTSITIAADGSISISTPKTVTIDAQENVSITSQADISIVAQGDLTLEGATVNINNGTNYAARINDSVVGGLITTGSGTVKIG